MVHDNHSQASEPRDDSVSASIGDFDEHNRFLDWCEFFAGVDEESCFSNVRSWENPDVHAMAWSLYHRWKEWRKGDGNAPSGLSGVVQ